MLRTPKRYSLHLYLGPTIPLGRLWPRDYDDDHNEECSHLLPSIPSLILDDGDNDDDVDDDDYDAEYDDNYVDVCDGRLLLTKSFPFSR